MCWSHAYLTLSHLRSENGGGELTSAIFQLDVDLREACSK